MHGYRVFWLELSEYLTMLQRRFDILGQTAGFREWMGLMIGSLALCSILYAYRDAITGQFGVFASLENDVIRSVPI